jgi:hypothetical protein
VKTDAQYLAGFIAVEIVLQGNEIDDLGDSESIVLMSDCPTINLVQLAEHILERFKRNTK